MTAFHPDMISGFLCSVAPGPVFVACFRCPGMILTGSGSLSLMMTGCSFLPLLFSFVLLMPKVSKKQLVYLLPLPPPPPQKESL